MILIFDHGTSGIKTCLMNHEGRFVAKAGAPVASKYPHPGWVEQDPLALWQLTQSTAEQALKSAGATWNDVKAIGITNQRETTILWDVQTGKPVYPAIVWQCRRTSDACVPLKKHETLVRERTGLVVDPYFSATKIRWILDNVPECAQLLRAGRLRFGTVDTWIAWNFTKGESHVTDTTNASRTLLYNIHEKRWDDTLLDLFGVPREILPEVRPSTQINCGKLMAIAGDQQAALYGQRCWKQGQAKSTYGTGTFLVMNLGQRAAVSTSGLLTTLACDAEGGACYALEGSVFISGAAIEWLRSGLRLIKNPQEADQLAAQVDSTDGVYFVPAFVGLAAPYWDAEARGMISGLTQGSTAAHLVRATFEAMAYQTRELLELMQREGDQRLGELRVDGGVTKGSFFLQFLADQLQLPVRALKETDLTAIGAGYLAGLGSGIWHDPEELAQLPEESQVVEPRAPVGKMDELYQGWLDAVATVTAAAHRS